jgi:hypothetical protein
MMSKGQKGLMMRNMWGTVGVVQSSNLAMPVGERENHKWTIWGLSIVFRSPYIPKVHGVTTAYATITSRLGVVMTRLLAAAFWLGVERIADIAIVRRTGDST